MSEARTAILDAIRKSKGQIGSAGDSSIEQRIGQHSWGPQPAWEEDRITRFTKRLQQASATLLRLQSSQDVAREVSGYIQRNELGDNLVSAATSRLNGIEWPQWLSVDYRAARAEDRVILTEAYGGIAETGSLVMMSSPTTPTSLNFLTDHFLCIVQANRVVDTIEDVWQRMREENSAMPRAINFVTGPSRTADVEQTIQLGAHGPRYVHILLLDE